MTLNKDKRMKNKLKEATRDVFEKIIYLCENNSDSESTLNEIRLKAKNRVIRFEWKEKYGIELGSDCRLAEYDFLHLGEYQMISYFTDGYKCYEEGCGRSISWSENNKQPVNEWIYSIGFSTGAYIFGEDYEGQKQLFQDFFEELRTYKPDYEDLHNHNLYWKVENAKKIMSQFKTILDKYNDKNIKELKSRKIAKLEAELESLTK
jgi:hypothetical protein